MIEVCRAGLMMTQFPATSGATVRPVRMARGKFHGAMATPTPRGVQRLHAMLARHGLRDDGCRQPAHLDGIEAAEVDRLGDVGIGFDPRFSGLKDEEGIEREAPRLHQVGGALDHPGPLFGRRVPPRRESRRPGGNRRIGVLGRASRPVADNLGWVGGVD